LTAKKPQTGTLYVCVESYVDGGDHEHPGYARGLRLDGGHPAVRKHPQYWLPADTPDDELHDARRALWGSVPIR
jgi:hypothetical protein